MPGPLSSIILETYCFTAKTTFMVANRQLSPPALPAPFFLAEGIPGSLAGSRRLPPCAAPASGRPGGCAAGSCSSGRGGRIRRRHPAPPRRDRPGRLPPACRRRRPGPPDQPRRSDPAAPAAAWSPCRWRGQRGASPCGVQRLGLRLAPRPEQSWPRSLRAINVFLGGREGRREGRGRDAPGRPGLGGTALGKSHAALAEPWPRFGVPGVAGSFMRRAQRPCKARSELVFRGPRGARN